MTLMVAADPIPLRVDETGTVRVGGTRLTLDTLISYHRQGHTPESIAEGFPGLSLADAYTAIGYYLNHRDELDAYLRVREEQAEALRREIEARSGAEEFGERLLAQRAQHPETAQ